MEEESEIVEDISESAFDFIVLIQNFNDEYFSDEYEILKFNGNFLESNGFAYQTKVDYMKLNRFIAATYNTIESNDIQVIDTLLSKFYNDGIAKEDIVRMTTNVKFKRHAKGDTIMNARETTKEVYFILNGMGVVVVEGKKIVATIDSGNMLGEVAF